jgi:hypothetical protein
MHIDIMPNRGSRTAYLLRESFRDGTSKRPVGITSIEPPVGA